MRQQFTFSELQGVGHEMTNEQQVQEVILSLLSNQEHIRVNLTNNDNIKTFDVVACHVELKEDPLHTKEPIDEVFMSEKMCRTYGSKYKKGKVKAPKYSTRGKEASNNIYKHKHRKHDGKKTRK